MLNGIVGNDCKALLSNPVHRIVYEYVQSPQNTAQYLVQ